MSFTYRCPEDLEAALNAYCAQTGATKTGTLNIALNAWLNTAASNVIYSSGVTSANALFSTFNHVQGPAVDPPPSRPDE